MITETKVFYNALELRDFLDLYSNPQLETMNIIDECLMVQVIEETLSDGSTVKNIMFNTGPMA